MLKEPLEGMRILIFINGERLSFVGRRKQRRTTMRSRRKKKERSEDMAFIRDAHKLYIYIFSFHCYSGILSISEASY